MAQKSRRNSFAFEPMQVVNVLEKLHTLNPIEIFCTPARQIIENEWWVVLTYLFCYCNLYNHFYLKSKYRNHTRVCHPSVAFMRRIAHVNYDYLWY